MSFPDTPRWTDEIRARAGFRVVLKTVLITAGICAFMAAYFFLLHHPAGPVFEVPSTPVDRRVPFHPAWLPAYLTLWFYISLGPGLQRDLRALAHYGLWIGAMSVVALMLFRLWPTRMPDGSMPATGDFPGYGLLRGVDKPGNTCPSMHVAAAIFTVIRVDAVLLFVRAPAALRLPNALWSAAIVYSTMAVRQHVFWDVVCGALLGAVFAVASLRYAPDGVP